MDAPKKWKSTSLSFRFWASAIAAIAMQGTAAAQQRFPFQLQDNLVRLPAKIDGQEVSAVLDSGTGAIILDRSAMERLAIAKGALVGSAVGGGNGVQTLTQISLSDLVVGPVHLQTLNGYAMTLSALSGSAGFPVEALIGTPVFDHTQIKVDYSTRHVTFRSSQAPLACKAPIPITIINGVPVAEVILRSTPSGPQVKLHLIVDMGTRRFAAIVGGSFVESEAGRMLLQSGVAEKIGTGTGGSVNGSVVHVSDVEIGQRHFKSLQIALTKEVKAFEGGQIDGTLGVPLWKTGAITFDYAHQRLCLDVPG